MEEAPIVRLLNMDRIVVTLCGYKLFSGLCDARQDPKRYDVRRQGKQGYIK